MLGMNHCHFSFLLAGFEAYMAFRFFENSFNYKNLTANYSLNLRNCMILSNPDFSVKHYIVISTIPEIPTF